MKRQSVVAVLGLSALALAACSNNGGGRVAANRNICIDFKKATPASGDGAPAVEACVQRWAYSLASSKDDADAVAEAVVTACSTPLQRWNQQSLAQPQGDAPSASILTGEPTTPLAEHSGFANDKALFYVVQARAGRCSPPPATNGAPEGVG
jgi:hypothetical protein